MSTERVSTGDIIAAAVANSSSNPSNNSGSSNTTTSTNDNNKSTTSNDDDIQVVETKENPLMTLLISEGTLEHVVLLGVDENGQQKLKSVTSTKVQRDPKKMTKVDGFNIGGTMQKLQNSKKHSIIL